MKDVKHMLAVPAALVLFIAIAAVILVSWCLTTVAKLDAGHGVRVVVLGDTSWHVDPIRTYYYEVRRGFSTIVPAYFIGASDSPMSFQLRVTTDARLVALIETSAPDIVLAMFDATTSETWPRGGDSEDHTSVHQRGRDFIARLQQSHPTTRFILSHDVSGSRTTKL